MSPIFFYSCPLSVSGSSSGNQKAFRCHGSTWQSSLVYESFPVFACFYDLGRLQVYWAGILQHIPQSGFADVFLMATLEFWCLRKNNTRSSVLFIIPCQGAPDICMTLWVRLAKKKHFNREITPQVKGATHSVLILRLGASPGGPTGRALARK